MNINTLDCGNCLKSPDKTTGAVCYSVAALILQAPGAIECGDDTRTDGAIARSRVDAGQVPEVTLLAARTLCATECHHAA